MPLIELQPVTKENWIACLRLAVSEDQRKLVADNSKSLAQAYVFDIMEPYVAFDGDVAVGFIMLEFEGEIGFVIRLMVGADHQGKGYGRAILERGIEILRADSRVKTIGTSHVPANSTVAKLYESLGFVAWPEVRELFDNFEDDGEVYLQLP